MLSEHFGGVLNNELICLDCPHQRQSPEPFLALSVPIAGPFAFSAFSRKAKPNLPMRTHATGKSNLEEALAQYVKGEMLDGPNAYMCGQCKKKIDTLKRSSIQCLPTTLIIHLKRKMPLL